MPHHFGKPISEYIASRQATLGDDFENHLNYQGPQKQNPRWSISSEGLQQGDGYSRTGCRSCGRIAKRNRRSSLRRDGSALNRRIAAAMAVNVGHGHRLDCLVRAPSLAGLLGWIKNEPPTIMGDRGVRWVGGEVSPRPFTVTTGPLAAENVG
jgi:hypothetical protein